MARPIRIEYPDAVYLVTCRGVNKKAIYKDDQDRTKFLEFLQNSKRTYNIEIFSYVLMKNHFHLLVKTPLGNLTKFMQQFNTTYITFFNYQHNRAGNLYQGRFKSIVIDPDTHLSTVSRYIHLNPVRVKGMITKPVKEKLAYLKEYRWSSFAGYITKGKTVGFVDYEPVLIESGGLDTTGRKGYREAICADMVDRPEIKKQIVGQCILGSEKFVKQIKEEILEKEPHKKSPSAFKPYKHKTKGFVIKLIEKETGQSIASIKKDKGLLRQLTMDLLYRFGGLNSTKIGEMFGVSYNAVSLQRKKIKESLSADKKFQALLKSIETRLLQ